MAIVKARVVFNEPLLESNGDTTFAITYHAKADQIMSVKVEDHVLTIADCYPGTTRSFRTRAIYSMHAVHVQIENS